jgi:GDP-L-fucose synthase
MADSLENSGKRLVMKPESRIFVAGHRGLVGSAIVRQLRNQGFQNLILRTRGELDLLDQAAVRAFFDRERPEFVFLAAAKVGGIYANNTYRADFIYQNLQVQNNIIDSAHRWGVRKLAFLGSSCIYPKNAPQPMREDALLSGPLEETNEPYAIAKIAGIKLAEAYRRQYGLQAISIMPTNLYGPGDGFDPLNSHVVPALLRRFHEAKVQQLSEVVIWGTGTPRRELLHVDDMADATVFLMQNYNDEKIINVGSGDEISIGDLARLIADVVGFFGEIVQDISKPDGTLRKLLDSSRLTALGWRPRIGLREGLQSTYQWYVRNADAEAESRVGVF